MQTHEHLEDEQEFVSSTDRGFGFVFAGVFGAIGVLRIWNARADALLWIVIAVVFALLALFWNTPLTPLNRLWGRFGRLLHAIVNPLLMGLIFVTVIVPMGLVLRLFGKDLLRLRRDPSATTYWIDCEVSASRPDAMKDQF
jgi:hypothetical protein